MKRRTIYLVAILTLGILVSASGQDTIQLSYTAKYNQKHLPLDSIRIMNLTQGTDTMLYAPDTVLLVEYIPFGTRINHSLAGSYNFSVSPNYPNPFVSHTCVDIWILQADDIVVRIFDLSGREHAYFEDSFDSGKHIFTFRPGKEKFYIFSVQYMGLTKAIKVTNTLSNQSDCELSYSGFEKLTPIFKSYNASYFKIYEGDNMRYIGYALAPDGMSGILASDVIEEVPVASNNTHHFDISLGIPCVSVPFVYYEGKTYNTVQIGSQCWLKENLNIGTMIAGLDEQTDNDTIEKYCFNDEPDSCEKYGGFYQWGEALGYISTPGTKGICPPGWHIPTDEEFKQLEGTVDSYYGYPDPIWDESLYRGVDVGLRLRSSSTWESTSGTNNYGFTALGTGSRFIDGTFWSLHEYTSFWNSNWYGGNIVWYRYMQDWKDGVCRTTAPANMGRSVRCLKSF